MPGFVVRGSLVYRPPCDYLLHAVSFDTSSFTSSRIFVEAFVQPLYHSYDHLAFTYGFRLGDDFWDIDEADPDRTFVAIAEEGRIHALSFFAEGLSRSRSVLRARPGVGKRAAAKDHAGQLARRPRCPRG